MKDFPETEKRQFLVKKGLTEAEIDEAVKRVNGATTGTASATPEAVAAAAPAAAAPATAAPAAVHPAGTPPLPPPQIAWPPLEEKPKGTLTFGYLSMQTSRASACLEKRSHQVHVSEISSKHTDSSMLAGFLQYASVAGLAAYATNWVRSNPDFFDPEVPAVYQQQALATAQKSGKAPLAGAGSMPAIADGVPHSTTSTQGGLGLGAAGINGRSPAKDGPDGETEHQLGRVPGHSPTGLSSGFPPGTPGFSDYGAFAGRSQPLQPAHCATCSEDQLTTINDPQKHSQAHPQPMPWLPARLT